MQIHHTLSWHTRFVPKCNLPKAVTAEKLKLHFSTEAWVSAPLFVKEMRIFLKQKLSAPTSWVLILKCLEN